MPLPIASQGLVASKIPVASILTDGSAGSVRLSSRLDPFVLSPLNGIQEPAVERTYYTAVMGARVTGVSLTLATGNSYATTQALMVVYNSNPVGGPDIIMDYVTIKIDTVQAAGGTFWWLYHAVDPVNRYASGGAQMPGYNCDGAQPPGVLAYSGLVTATTAGPSARDVGVNFIQNGIGVANMLTTLRYGRLENPPAGTFTIPTTAVAQSAFDVPPVVIPPGSSYVMNEFQVGRATTAAVGEIFMGFIVR